MLTSYITDTQRLLQNPIPTTGLYSDLLIKSAVNKARRQLAGATECVRRIGTIDTVSGTREYSFADVDLNDEAVGGIINVRRINFVNGDGESWITPRPWEWFDQYCINNPVPFGDLDNPGARFPQVWAQYAQGASASTGLSNASGSFYIDPIPDGVYTLKLDCACFPVELENDTTNEALPALFTDAIPFFAAWYILLGAQNQARMADAERYYKYYLDYQERARQAANPSVLRPQYEGSTDPAQRGKVGAQ